MTTENTTNQPLPLYKRLNEERTQGEFIVDGDMIICTDNPCTYPTSYNDGIVIFENATGENTTDDSIVAHFHQHSANKLYTALAVNNLAALAEALESLHSACMNGEGIHVEWWSKNKETVAKAKEALARIS